MTGMGNHERDWPGTGTIGMQDSGGECGTPTQHRFTMPVPSRKQEAGWYSFDMGPVHVVMLFTELPCGKGSSQYDFLAADLAAVDRAVTPWVVVGGHRPMYWTMLDGSLGPDTSDNFCHGARDLEPLFFAHEVDLALWGHVHNTLVTCPVFNGRCGDPAGGAFAGTLHGRLGLAVALLALTQPLTALARPSAPAKPGDAPTTRRRVWVLAHRAAGCAALAGAVPTALLGVAALRAPPGATAAGYALLGSGAALVVALVVALEVRRCLGGAPRGL
jgi:hypothetical protein